MSKKEIKKGLKIPKIKNKGSSNFMKVGIQFIFNMVNSNIKFKF